jgi:hypothetical protein
VLLHILGQGHAATAENVAIAMFPWLKIMREAYLCAHEITERFAGACG